MESGLQELKLETWIDGGWEGRNISSTVVTTGAIPMFKGGAEAWKAGAVNDGRSGRSSIRDEKRFRGGSGGSAASPPSNHLKASAGVWVEELMSESRGPAEKALAIR